MKKIVISLTTISSRIDTVYLVIESLLAQEIEESFQFCVDLYISEDPYMLDEGVKTIPSKLTKLCNDERFNIRFVPNIGSYRKFYYSLNDYYKGTRDLDYLVTADDDTIYPQGWLNTLVKSCDHYNCCIAYRGRRMLYENNILQPYKRWMHSNPILKQDSMLNVGTGKDGIIYKPSFFHPGVVDILNCIEKIGHADDLWLKAHVALRLVPTVILEPNLSHSFENVPGSSELSLYNNVNRKGGNDLSMVSLKKFLLHRYRVDIDDFFTENLTGSSTLFQVLKV